MCCEGRRIFAAHKLILVAASYNVWFLSAHSSAHHLRGMAGMVPGLFHTGGFRSQYGLVISAQQCVVYFEITTHIGDLPVCYLIFVAASFVEEWLAGLLLYSG